ncbi:hypothetical protein BH10PSE6_BH10PSE6_38710 [soil metagenome]
MSSEKEIELGLLRELREAFASGAWGKTQAIYETMSDIVKRKRNIRVEATCLVSRALMAQNDRTAARNLLKRIGGEEFSKPIHYDFLARAYLDIRNYKEVMRCCEQAMALQAAEKAKKPAE